MDTDYSGLMYNYNTNEGLEKQGEEGKNRSHNQQRDGHCRTRADNVRHVRYVYTITSSKFYVLKNNEIYA